MAKISELPPITGANTRSEDLFVIVNLVQGDDGTSNITRKELVEAIQYEVFSRITITGGTISGVVMSDSRLDNVKIDNSDIEDTNFVRGTVDDTVITDSTANNITMTSSTFTNGGIFDSTANNVTITQSVFNDGTGNNVVLTNSELNDSTANNVAITNSSFDDGTGNNVVLTNSTIDDSTITDSVANNITITSSSFTTGTMSDVDGDNIRLANSVLNDSTANNVTITQSVFNDGTGNNVTLTSSIFDDGVITDSTGNNVVLTSSQLNDSTSNNTIITNSQFNDGTGNNVTLTNSTIDDSVFTDGTISNTDFQGTMQNVVATDMTIRSSSADGLGANNSTFDNGALSGSVFSGGTIDRSRLADFDMDLTKEFEAPIDDDSYFAIRNEKTGDTEQINFGQLFEEVSKKTAQALKVHADAGSGDDKNPGTMLAPVKTLERAFELCLEKAGGELNRNAINNAVHISVGPGTYYTKGNLQLPDDCSCTSTAGQYATVIELLPGFENNNGILVGSGCYVQGFGYQNFKVDNFDFPEGGFAIAYRPGAKLLRSPYLRDSTQLSNFLRQDVEPPLNPYNSKGTLADLGQTFTLAPGHTFDSGNGSLGNYPGNGGARQLWQKDDEVVFSSGAVGFLSWEDTDDVTKGNDKDIEVNRIIRVRNLKNGEGFAVGDTVTCESGGTGVIQSIGMDDFPNREVGRGGGCVLADRRVLDTDSLYTYVLCFGFTPRTQNGLGYVARDGAGVNGIGSLSIFVRCAFYALNGGQMTLNNSGTQFGDISMRAKGTTEFFAPRGINSNLIIGNTVFADTIDNAADDVIDDVVDYLTANSANGGLGYKEYDSEKCLRDSGIIIDGTGYDVALDTNYWGRLAGITYRSPISYVVPGEQLEETKGANEYLRDRSKEIFVSANNEINPRIDTSFAELLNVLEYGEENINPIIWQDTSVPRTAARTLLQDNREFVTEELIDWIENNDEFFAYDSKSCRRDVSDYIIPAVKNDMLFETNYNSLTAGRAYYMQSAKAVIQNQNNETVAAYNRLKDQTNELIDGDSYLASQRLDDAYDNILQILENKGKQYTPTGATYDPVTGLFVITMGNSKAHQMTDGTYDPATGIMEANIGAHELEVGDFVWFNPESVTWSCDTGSGPTNHAVPEPHHPYYEKPCPIIGVSRNKIRMNVGYGGDTGQQVHTFVSATPNAIQSGHGLSIGDYVLLKRGGFTMTCSRDNHTTRAYYPKAGYPADETPVEVLGAVPHKITVDVGTQPFAFEYQFIEAAQGAVTVLGDTIKWSDSASIPANKRNARKQLQRNRTFLMDYVDGYLDETYFRYDSAKCRRDVREYILPAVERDLLTGSNYNAYQTGLAYRAGTELADNVINDQLVQTTGAINELKRRVNTLQAESGFQPTDVTYDPSTGIMVATIGAHTLAVGDTVVFAMQGITFSCDTGSGPTNHAVPEAHHPYANGVPCPIIGVSNTTITLNPGYGGSTGQQEHTFVSAVANAITPAKNQGLSFTPTDASYNPESGIFTATIGRHKLQAGDYVRFAEDGVTFSCDTGSGPTNDAVPNPGHPFFNHPCPIESTTPTTITMFVGYGGSNPHTFVSASNNAISHVKAIDDKASGFRSDEAFDKITSILNSTGKTYSTSDSAYDPITGLNVLTIGSHDLQIGQEILIAPESLTYTCDLDGNASQHSYPTKTVTNFTPSTATYDPATGEFTADIGTNKLRVGDKIKFATRGITWSCLLDNNQTSHPEPEEHHPNFRKEVTLTSVEGNVIGCNVGKVRGNYASGTHTFVSAITGAIQGTREHPAYKKPMVVAATSNTTITINAGTSSDTSPHTFISATANNIKTRNYISTYTPRTATYNEATGVMTATIGQHNLEAGDYITIKPRSFVFTCTMDGNVYNHAVPQEHHSITYKKPIRIDSATSDTITMNVGAGPGGAHTFVSAEVNCIDADALLFTDPASVVKHYTPTTSTYDPTSGITVMTIPGHDLTTNDYVQFAPYSFTYTCTQDGNATEHSYPRKGDAVYNTPTAVTAVNGNDVTVQLLASSGGTHTFVSAIKDSVAKVTYNSQGQYAREQIQANREFLQKEVNNYLDSEYFVFNGEKCTRDSGFILDSVRRDIATGSTWNSQFMGLGYRTGSVGANKVINDQLTQTVGAINYLKSEVAGDPNVTGTALTRANQHFDRIINIISNGAANTGVTTYGDEAALTEDHKQASNQLIANRAFIIAETNAWLSQNTSHSYDTADCARDTGYLVDSLAQDVRFGGNTCSVNFARLYFENGESVLPISQKEPFVKVWEHIAEVAWSIVRDITITPSTGNAVTQDVTGTDRGIEVANLARDRVNIVTQALSDDTIDHLPDYIEPNVETAMVTACAAIDGISENISLSVIDYLRKEHKGLPYAAEVCERDVGLIVDAVSRDIEYGGNENTLEVFDYYFRRFNSASADYEQLRSTNVLPIEVKGQFKVLSDYEDTANVSGLRESINVLPYEQREPTKKAFSHLADVAEKIAKEVAHTTNFTTFNPTDATYDPATGVFTATIGSHTLDVGNKVYLKPNGFTFSCDMGSGPQNHTEPQAHHPHYRKAVKITSITSTSITMNVGTGGSGQYAHSFVSADTGAISTGPYQNTDGTAADTATATRLHDLIESIAQLVDDVNIEDDEFPTLTKASFDPNRTLARKQLQQNRDFIIEEVQGYLKDRYYTFDGDRCKRDIGLLLDAVAVDVLTGSNYNAVFNGTAYRIDTVSTNRVINEQLTETVEGIKFARGLAVKAVTDSALKVKVEEAFDEIIDVMTNGRSAADAINFTTNAQGVARINGRSQLQNNKAFLIAEATAWVEANYPSHVHDVAKCERDTGYLIDAVSFDGQHQGNFATQNFTRLYFEKGVNVGLPTNQVEPSAMLFKHIGDCVDLIVQDTDIAGLKSANNALSQDFSSGSGGAPLGAEMEGLFDLCANALTSATLLLNPAYELPKVSNYAAVNQTAFNEVLGVKETVAKDLLAYLAENYDILPFSEEKCRRDAGYIIDAVSHDIQYGGNAASVQTAGMYFENTVNTGLQIEQYMGTRDAFLHMAKVIEHVVGAKDIETKLFPRTGKYYTGDIVTKYEYWNGVPSYQTTEAQDFSIHGANPNTCIATRKLVELIANAVDDSYEVRSTIPERIDVDQTWMGDNYVTAKELVERLSHTAAEGVISYISVNHNGLSFPRARCRRDIGYTIDAISHDVQYETNFASLQSAGIYFEKEVSVLKVDQQRQYADILQLLGNAMSQVVQETPVTNASTYTLTPQNTLGVAATSTEGTEVTNLVGIIEQSIRSNDNDELPRPVSTSSFPTTELSNAAQKLVDNTEELASDVTEFINNQFTVLDYNKDKCRRDTGFLLDAFSFDLNFGGNTASRWNADFYFWNQVYRLPEDQREPTAKAYRQLGKICKDIVIGEYEGQKILGELGTAVESKKVKDLADIFFLTQINNDTKYLPVKTEPDYSYSDAVFTDAQDILAQRRKGLQKDTVRYVNATYNFLDINLTRRDARNLLTALQNDFKYVDTQAVGPSYQTNGNQNAIRTFTATFFDYDGTHVFPVFNPTMQGLKYKGSVVDVAALSSITGQKPNWAYIVATDFTTNLYAGNIYYWNGSTWVLEGANNTDLLDAFTGSWDRMRDYLVNNLSPDSDHTAMIQALFDNCLKSNVLKPDTLVFGSLVESIAHQFNGASAGVNRNALPLNFRNLGAAISAVASVLNEDGGRIRWSGADELNNQYFARGLRINGRTGRIEGRPFTSSVRKLARRASNSRAVI